MPVTLFRGDVAPQADGTQSSYGLVGNSLNELRTEVAIPDLHVLADRGEYFVAKTATPGTGVALITSLTTFATTDTQPSGIIFNTAAANTTRIYLDYLRLTLTAGQLPTTATNMQIAIDIDSALARYTSGGTALTPKNVNGDSNNASVASVLFGATIAAVAGSTNRRVLFSDYIEPIVGTTPCAVAGDMYCVKFGGVEHTAMGSYYQLSAGTPLQVKIITASAPPIIIGGQSTLALRIWGTAVGAAATYECELGWYERY